MAALELHQQNQRRRQLLQQKTTQPQVKTNQKRQLVAFKISSADVALNAETTLSTTAEANTTRGVATASNNGEVIDGARLGNSTVNAVETQLSVAPLHSTTTRATNVSGGDVNASAGIKNSKGISHENNPSAQLNVKGDGSVTGTISNSKHSHRQQCRRGCQSNCRFQCRRGSVWC